MTHEQLCDYIKEASGYRPAPSHISRIKHGRGGKLSTALWMALLKALEKNRSNALEMAT